MTEDEAFIRAIVDSPGDETPRLVYADWLDERADPRGKYLRAELKAVVRKTGRVKPASVRGLAKLAEGLDPVWVARVSRPPVGVCCDRLRFEDSGPPVSLAAITAAGLPPETPPGYIAFLLNYNGGNPEPCDFRPPSGLDWEIAWFFDLSHLRVHRGDERLGRIVSIGETHPDRERNGRIRLSVGGAQHGRVWIEYIEYTAQRMEERTGDLAPDFVTLLSLIR
jgi:uncharacterized protein (TIGR02996 family)